MSYPLWYVHAVTVILLILGLLASIAGGLWISTTILDKILLHINLHRCFIDFMAKWLREKRAAKEAPHA